MEIEDFDGDATRVLEIATSSSTISRRDIAEQSNVAAAHPDIVARIAEIMRTGRTESELFPLVGRG